MFSAKTLFKDPDQFREEIERLGAITMGSYILNKDINPETASKEIEKRMSAAKQELTPLLEKHDASIVLLTFLDLLHKLSTTTESDVAQAIAFAGAQRKTQADA